MDQLLGISQLIQNVALTAAVIGGGLWAIYRYRRLREERLSIEFKVQVQSSTRQINGLVIVTLVFLMRNAGSRALRLAKEIPISSKGHGSSDLSLPIYETWKGTPYHKIAYRNCEMKLWKLETPVNSTPSLVPLIDSTKAVEVRLAKKPVNLLEENAINPDRFWLEPGEIVHIATNFCLEPGYYAGKITTLFDMPAITSKNRYTFDDFTFAFEVTSGNQEISRDNFTDVETIQRAQV